MNNLELVTNNGEQISTSDSFIHHYDANSDRNVEEILAVFNKLNKDGQREIMDVINIIMSLPSQKNDSSDIHKTLEEKEYNDCMEKDQMNDYTTASRLGRLEAIAETQATNQEQIMRTLEKLDSKLDSKIDSVKQEIHSIKTENASIQTSVNITKNLVVGLVIAVLAGIVLQFFSNMRVSPNNEGQQPVIINNVIPEKAVMQPSNEKPKLSKKPQSEPTTPKSGVAE